jgi:hypothetical protein
MKNVIFKWTTTNINSFEDFKKKVSGKSVLVLPNFNKVFQVDYDASGSPIGVILSQEGIFIAFFKEK